MHGILLNRPVHGGAERRLQMYAGGSGGQYWVKSGSGCLSDVHAGGLYACRNNHHIVQDVVALCSVTGEFMYGIIL